MRLNKFIAHATGMARREADEAILNGRISVNGKVANIGKDVDGQSDIIKLDDKQITLPATTTVIMLNKPIGYVCSRNAQAKDAKTVYELLPSDLRQLKTIGRLDKDSSGLILLTDDGDMAHKLTHPSFTKTKEYVIELDRPLAPLHQQMIADFGINLTDGPSKLLLERLNDERTKFRVIMHKAGNPCPLRQTADCVSCERKRFETVCRKSKTIWDPILCGAESERE